MWTKTVAAGVVAVLLTACGSEPDDTFGERSPDGGYWPKSVQLGVNQSLGQMVVDGSGFTLYRFDKDKTNPSASVCADNCARQWPPVLANDKITFANLKRPSIGVLTRGDGTQQVTIAGSPIYRFAQDTVPGQTNGQGVDGTWFVIGPDGGKAGGGKKPNQPNSR